MCKQVISRDIAIVLERQRATEVGEQEHFGRKNIYGERMLPIDVMEAVSLFHLLIPIQIFLLGPRHSFVLVGFHSSFCCYHADLGHMFLGNTFATSLLFPGQGQ
jgi:hypothetical protein